MKPWVLTYKEAKSLVICGDIHGEFVPLVYEMCMRYNMHDTLVIIAGDCGFGFEKAGYYDQVFRHIEKRLVQGKVYYWSDEVVQYDAIQLDAIREAGLKIDTVVTHTAPSFCEFRSKEGLVSWAQDDPGVIEDCESERQIVDKIFAHLKRDGHPLERWYYGHFHSSWHSEIDGVWYKMLDIMELLEVPQIISG